MRFQVPEHGVRDIKDAISRTVIAELDKQGIEIASATVEIVGLPKLNFSPLFTSNPVDEKSGGTSHQ